MVEILHGGKRRSNDPRPIDRIVTLGVQNGRRRRRIGKNLEKTMGIHASATELKMEATAVRIGVGSRTSGLVAELGFSPEEDVILRLELRPAWRKRSLQEKMLEIAAELAILETRLRSMVASLPEVTDAMMAREVPYSVEAMARGALEVLLTDDLGPAIRRLEEAARLTPEILREEWERERDEEAPSAPEGE
jgi:hypothetical protein